MLIVGLRGSVRVTAVTELIRRDLYDVTAIRAGLMMIGPSLFRLVNLILDTVMEVRCMCLISSLLCNQAK